MLKNGLGWSYRINNRKGNILAAVARTGHCFTAIGALFIHLVVAVLTVVQCVFVLA